MTTTKTTSLITSLLDGLASFVRGAFVSLTIDGQPVPASRPRVGRFGTYYSKTYQVWRKAALIDASGKVGFSTDKPVAVVLEFVVTKPKTSKLDHPKPDIDNFAKAPLDVVNDVDDLAWTDDSQIVVLCAMKRFAEPSEEPCVNIWYAEYQ